MCLLSFPRSYPEVERRFTILNQKGKERKMAANEGASSSRGLLFPEYIRRSNTFPEMTLEEKERFIEELSNISEKAQRKLSLLQKPDILELVNVETRKEQRSTNKTKRELINLLCNIISTKINQGERHFVGPACFGTLSIPPLNVPASASRKRKRDHLFRLPLHRKCPNSSCQAALKLDDSFCKQCSCYICFRYDKHKVPSFWLVCESETHLLGRPCGLSCHLECALDERAAVMANESGTKMDGSFPCKNCGNVNDLISCWRKLLMEAKDARRVSGLCSRIDLSYKILNSSEKYQNLHVIIHSIKIELEDEVGSLSIPPSSMSRGLVQRLSFGREAQKRCSLAIGLLDSISLSAPPSELPEDIVVTNDNNLEADVNFQGPELKADKSRGKDVLMIDLNKVPENHVEGNHSIDGELRSAGNGIAAAPTSTFNLDPSPTGIKQGNEGSKARNEIKVGCNSVELRMTDTNYQKIVNTIRLMERDGDVDSSFRKEFVTWLSMRATPKNTMQVAVFLDTFHDDPKSLVEQLVHTFGEETCSMRLPPNAIVS